MLVVAVQPAPPNLENLEELAFQRPSGPVRAATHVIGLRNGAVSTQVSSPPMDLTLHNPSRGSSTTFPPNLLFHKRAPILLQNHFRMRVKSLQ